MADALRTIMDDAEKRKELEKCCAKALKRDNLWVHRARQIVSDLGELQ